MNPCWALVFAVVASTAAQTSPRTNALNQTAGYRFRYFVKDERTGDVKGQTEIRQGDNVRGSYAVAEPNGNTRVVTYTAGKDTGFNARVQVHPGNPSGRPLPPTSESRESPLPLSHLMKMPPRNIYRTGFQPVEIKVVPPSTTEIPQVTQKPPFTPEEEQVLRGQELPSTGYSEQHLEIFNSPTEGGRVQSGSAIHHEVSSTPVSVVSSTTPQADSDQPCAAFCDDEGRARIKQEGDKVQLEMEQVIRAEMKDPEGVKMGEPYAANPQKPRPDGGMPPLPFTQFRPDIMTPIYMKPLYLRSQHGPSAPQWPPIVASGNRLYIPHVTVENEDVPPEVFPSKVYLVPIPRPLQLSQEELMSLAYPWEGRTPIPNEELSMPYRPNRPTPRPTLTYPPTFTYLLIPKQLRGK